MAIPTGYNFELEMPWLEDESNKEWIVEEPGLDPELIFTPRNLPQKGGKIQGLTTRGSWLIEKLFALINGVYRIKVLSHYKIMEGQKVYGGEIELKGLFDDDDNARIRMIILYAENVTLEGLDEISDAKLEREVNRMLKEIEEISSLKRPARRQNWD